MTSNSTPKRPAGVFVVTEMLGPEEIERLKRRAKETSAQAQNFYPALRLRSGKPER
jgi:hypothetical protein